MATHRLPTLERVKGALPRAMRRRGETLALLLLIGLCFGVYIPWLGAVGDDWQYLYAYHIGGAAGLPAFLQADRPFSALLYGWLMPALGETILPYHLALLAARAFDTLAFLVLLRRLWPGQKNLTFAAAALFAVYPGFLQQPIPVEFILHFVVLGMHLLSLILMLKALHSGRRAWLWLLPSALLALGMFANEYFVGLELLRPLILWLGVRQTIPDRRRALAAALPRYAPFALALGGFLYWRVFVFGFQFYQPTLLANLKANPDGTLAKLGWQILTTLGYALIQAWQIRLDAAGGLPAVFLTLAALVVLAAACYALYARVAAKDTSAAGWPIALGGAAALLLAGWPFWLTSVPIWLTFPWDRPLLAFMPGAALTLAWALEAAFQPRARRLALAALTALALVGNFQNASLYIHEWQAMRGLFSQLLIRAPGIQPGTMLLADLDAFNYVGDNSLSAALNWIYAPASRSPQLAYRIFELQTRRDLLADLSPALEVNHAVRTLRFSGSPARMIALVYDPPGCLYLLGADDFDAPGMTQRVKDAVPLSNPALVEPRPAVPARLPALLGAPVDASWCAYYERAELLRQNADWDGVLTQWQAAEQTGVRPNSAFERRPFVEAFARRGQLDAALAAMPAPASLAEGERRVFCRLWGGLRLDIPWQAADAQRVDDLLTRLGCE